jgi:integrase/recombinase XerD
MPLGKQSKVLSDKQVESMGDYLAKGRNGIRNHSVLLLSVKAGLRAKEIASLKWSMLVNPDGQLGDTINLTNAASKGNSGRIIPINKTLQQSLETLLAQESKAGGFNADWHVVRSERSESVSSQTVINMFQRWYRTLGYVGCSSHSGRRTFITNASRKISMVGGSLRDVQVLAGHKNLQTTQRYIDYDTECQRKVVNLV